MTARELETAFLNETLADELAPILLAEFEFASATVRFWTGYGDLSWNSQTWTGGGSLIGVSAVEETTDMKAVGATFTLSGVPSALISTALGEDYQGLPAALYLGALDSSGAVVEDPVKVFAGRMDVMEIEDGGETATISLTVESALADLERPRERRFTDEDQQELFPGDLGLEYVPSIQGKEVVWK